VGQKMFELVFLRTSSNYHQNLLIFGRRMAKTIALCEVQSLSTSRILCQRTTV